MGAHRGSSSPVEKAGSWDKEAWEIFWSVGVDIVDVFVVVDAALDNLNSYKTSASVL